MRRFALAGKDVKQLQLQNKQNPLYGKKYAQERLQLDSPYYSFDREWYEYKWEDPAGII